MEVGTNAAAPEDADCFWLIEEGPYGGVASTAFKTKAELAKHIGELLQLNADDDIPSFEVFFGKRIKVDPLAKITVNIGGEEIVVPSTSADALNPA